MSYKKQNIINILGVNISTLRKKEVLQKIEKFLSDGKQHQIITPNPEFLLAAREDEEFFYILNQADLALPDGFGLKLAAWLMGKNLFRIAGADLILDLLKIAQEKNLKVAVINWSGGLSGAHEIKSAIEKKYHGLEVYAEDTDKEWSKFNPGKINAFKPDIIFCALGAPWQDKFIYHNLEKMPSAKLGIGVGGGLDYLTGKALRAPLIMRFLGFEWLWRLIRQPKRLKRIYNAVFVFLWVFFKWRFILPLFYRSNIACILFKIEGDAYKILLVQRSDQGNHWQLPQGGTDGEDLKTAGERELREEIGTNKFKTAAILKNLYKYKFKERSGKYNLFVNRATGCKGQKQGLCIAEFFGSDKDIKINFWDHKGWKWVDAENLIKEVHPVRQEAAKIFLEKFNHITHNKSYV